MKLSAYQLCRWCDAAAHGLRKWFLLAGSVVLLLLCLLTHWHAPLILLLFCGPVLGLYELHRRKAFGKRYMRLPRPVDAMCETVLIDASLIGQGTRLRAAAQPIDVADGLSMRLGNGALLLGTAMVLTSDELPLADRSAVLSAVGSLNLRPSRLRSHNPILRRDRGNGLTTITVRDGMNNRRYLVGTPLEVAAACQSIWEGSPRPLTPHDLARIEDTMRYITQGDCRTWAYATALEKEAPIFLGMAGVGETLLPDSSAEVSKLQGMGLTLMLDAGIQSEEDLESLRALMDIPAHHARADIHLTPHELTGEFPLGVSRKPGESLSEPIILLRKHFHTIEDTLRRFGLMLLTMLIPAFLSGSLLLAIACAALFSLGAVFIGVDRAGRKMDLPCAATLLAIALLQTLFLSARGGSAMLAAGILPCVLTFMGVFRLGGRGFGYRGQGALWCWGITGFCALGAVFFAVKCVLGGLANLLAVGFALLLSAAAALLILFEEKIFK